MRRRRSFSLVLALAFGAVTQSAGFDLRAQGSTESSTTQIASGSS
jgi:hypothetical protein